MVNDDKEREFICFNQSAFNEMPVGAGVAVEITERGDQTPTIDLITGGAEKPAEKPKLPMRVISRDSSQKSFACSYAKDVVVAIIKTSDKHFDIEKITPKQARGIANLIKAIANDLNAWLISSSEIAEKIEETLTDKSPAE